MRWGTSQVTRLTARTFRDEITLGRCRELVAGAPDRRVRICGLGQDVALGDHAEK